MPNLDRISKPKTWSSQDVKYSSDNKNKLNRTVGKKQKYVA